MSIASWAATGRYFHDGGRGQRQGAVTGRTREIWPTAGGGFVSFGLRGGKARVPTLNLSPSSCAGTASSRLGASSATGTTYSTRTTAADDELRAIEAAIGEYFSRHTMEELYDIACETNLMLAPTASNREILESKQLAAREYFGPVGDIARFPGRSRIVRSADGLAAPARPRPSGPARSTPDPRQHGPAHPRAVRRTIPRVRYIRAAGVGRDKHPRVRLGRRRSDRHPVTSPSTAPRCCASSRRPGPTSCGCSRSGRITPRPRGLADMFDALNVGKRNDLAQPQEPRGRGRSSSGCSMGRRRRGELRAARR